MIPSSRSSSQLSLEFPFLSVHAGLFLWPQGLKRVGRVTAQPLISTPITGVDSILVIYGMFDWAFTIYRVVTSMIISIIAGILTNFYAKEESCSSGTCKEQKGNFLTRAFSYAFGTLLKDIAFPLLVGLLLGALITVEVSENLSEILVKYNWFSYIIVIAIAVPMYVCATASLPMAAGLMLTGVLPRAAFVFLSIGPAINTVTIGIVKKMLGTTTLYIYLGTIIIGSIIFGLGLDYLFRDVSVSELVHMNENFGIIAWTSTVLLWSFVLSYMIKPHFVKETASCSVNQDRMKL